MATLLNDRPARHTSNRGHDTRRSSPAVRRTAAILNFLADNPEQPFSLTALVRALKMSQATCRECLAALVETGYLHRLSNRTYVMGPRLVSIGDIPRECLSPLQRAQREMRSLANGFDVVCSSIVREGDQCIWGSRALAMSQVSWPIPPGTRALLRAPFAATYYAWTHTAAVQDWLEHADPVPTPVQCRAMFEAMAFTRAHGFSFYVSNPRAGSAAYAPELAFSRSRTVFPVSMPAQLESAQSYALNSIAAPVFDASGSVSLVLSLMGFSGSVLGERIAKIGSALRAACDRLGHPRRTTKRERGSFSVTEANR